MFVMQDFTVLDVSGFLTFDSVDMLHLRLH